MKAPDTANIWLKHIKDSLKSLSTFPARFPIIEEKLFDADIHRLVFGKHLVYYWIDEENLRVWVIAVLYARRDQLRELKNLII